MYKIIFSTALVASLFLPTLSSAKDSEWPSNLAKSDYSIRDLSIISITPAGGGINKYNVIEFDNNKGTVSVRNSDLFKRGSKVELRTIHLDKSVTFLCISNTDNCVKANSK